MARPARIEMDGVYQESQEEIANNANTVDFEDVAEPQNEQETPDFMKE